MAVEHCISTETEKLASLFTSLSGENRKMLSSPGSVQAYLSVTVHLGHRNPFHSQRTSGAAGLAGMFMSCLNAPKPRARSY